MQFGVPGAVELLIVALIAVVFLGLLVAVVLIGRAIVGPDDDLVERVTTLEEEVQTLREEADLDPDEDARD